MNANVAKPKPNGARNGSNGHTSYRGGGGQQQKNSPRIVIRQQDQAPVVGSKHSQSSMTARLQEKKEDIDILVFRDPGDEGNLSKDDLESSQRALIFSAQANVDRYGTPQI